MYRSLSSPRRVLVQVAASGLLAGTLVAAPADIATGADIGTVSAVSVASSAGVASNKKVGSNDSDDPDSGEAVRGRVPLNSLPGARLLDSRGPGTTDGEYAGTGRHQPHDVLYVQIAGRGGLPADATAATLSVVGVGATGWGHVTVWPCASDTDPVPNSSVLNLAPGWTRANSLTTSLGVTGGVCVYSNIGLDLVVDVQSYSRGDGLTAISPVRIVDSRDPSHGPFAFNETRRYVVSDQIPAATGASAVFANITTVGATADGFITVWPCASVSDPMPNSSIVNFVPGEAVANNAVIGLINDGFCVFSYQPAHIIIDISGYLSPDAAIDAITPDRYLDTREMAAWHPSSTGRVEVGRYAAGETRAFDLAAAYGNDVTAVIANITVVTPGGDNHLTAWPCESATEPVPNTSMLNYNRAWSATPNTSVQTLSDTGLLCVYSYAAADIIIDINALVRGADSGHTDDDPSDSEWLDPNFPAVDIGGGIVAYDMTTGRQNEFDTPLRYGLYFCDVTNIADTHDRWGDPWLIGDDPWVPNRDPFTATNVAAYTQAAFNDITATLIEGRTTVIVTLRADLDADPDTGTCDFDNWSERPDNEGSIFVRSHLDLDATYSGLATLSMGRNASIWMNADGWYFGRILAHEFGHNLGWKHSNYTLEYVDGRRATYDSVFDRMGSGDGYVTTFDRLVQIGAISPHQLVGHNTGTTSAALAAHAHYTGTVATHDSTRAVVVAPPSGTLTRAGTSVLLGIEAGIRTRNIHYPEPGVTLNLIRSGGTGGNNQHLLNAPMTSSHPVSSGPDQWESSFVAAGESRTVFGVTVTVTGTNPDGTVNVTVTGELSDTEWAPAATSFLNSLEHDDHDADHDADHCEIHIDQFGCAVPHEIPHLSPDSASKTPLAVGCVHAEADATEITQRDPG